MNKILNIISVLNNEIHYIKLIMKITVFDQCKIENINLERVEVTK